MQAVPAGQRESPRSRMGAQGATQKLSERLLTAHTPPPAHSDRWGLQWLHGAPLPVGQSWPAVPGGTLQSLRSQQAGLK